MGVADDLNKRISFAIQAESASQEKIQTTRLPKKRKSAAQRSYEDEYIGSRGSPRRAYVPPTRAQQVPRSELLLLMSKENICSGCRYTRPNAKTVRCPNCQGTEWVKDWRLPNPGAPLLLENCQ